MALKDCDDVLEIIAKIVFDRTVHVEKKSHYDHIKAGYKCFTGFYSFITVLNRYSGVFKENTLYLQLVSLYPKRSPKVFCKGDIAPKIFEQDADVLLQYAIDKYPWYWRHCPNLEDHIYAKCMKRLYDNEKKLGSNKISNMLACEFTMGRIFNRLDMKQITDMLRLPIYDPSCISILLFAILRTENIDPHFIVMFIAKNKIPYSYRIYNSIANTRGLTIDEKHDVALKLREYYREMYPQVIDEYKALFALKW
jgi:hypothetical protein